MRTVFAHYTEYDPAAEAFEAAQEQAGEQARFNVIVLESIAKNALEDRGFNLEKIKTEKSSQVDGVGLHGLDSLLAGEQPVQIPGLGKVYAAGQIADILTTTASDPDAANGGLQAAFQDFDLSMQAARDFSRGIENGGLLLFVRAQDEYAAAVKAALEPKASATATV